MCAQHSPKHAGSHFRRKGVQKEASQEGGFLPPHVILILAQGKGASEDTFVPFYGVSRVTSYFVAFL